MRLEGGERDRRDRRDRRTTGDLEELHGWCVTRAPYTQVGGNKHSS